MSRVKKVRSLVKASSIPERLFMLGAIDKCLAHQGHRAAATAVELLLAFGKRRANKATSFSAAEETEFRLYARMTICLVGYISMPALTKEVQELAAAFKGEKHYADVDYAKKAFDKYKRLALAIQTLAPVAIIDLSLFQQKTNQGEGNVSDRINKAVRVGNDSMRTSIKRLKADDADTQMLVTRWFGQGARAQLLENFEKLMARADDPLNPIFIEFEQDLNKQDAWGTSLMGSRGINLGTKFFDDQHTLPASKLGKEYIANGAQILHAKDVSAQYAELKRQQVSLNLIIDATLSADGKETLTKNVDDFADIAKQFNKSEVAKTYATKKKFADQLMIDLQFFGFKAADSVATFKAGRPAAEAIYNTHKARLLAGQGDLTVMEVTAFGTYVHELTHMVLGTNDEDTSCVGVPGQKAYGPLLCQMLAAEAPAKALTNADNYRHFVECWVD